MVVGGLISLAGATRVNAGSGLVQTVNVNVKTALTAHYDVLFFDTNPVNSTFTDNYALDVNAADLPYLCGVAHCTDLIAVGGPRVLQGAQPGAAVQAQRRLHNAVRGDRDQGQPIVRNDFCRRFERRH